LDGALIEDGTLLIACSGDLHNLSLEPGKPDCISIMTRLPGLAYFGLSRGLYGGNPSATNCGKRSGKISILADSNASDIPLASKEGELAAKLWDQVGNNVDFPSSWPDGDRIYFDFLHVAGHGMLEDGVGGSKHSVILRGREIIGEPEIQNAPIVQEAFVNICVAGQSHDNPLNGNPSGIIPGFLRRGTKWIVASLLPLPDTWALLGGLIIADLRSTSEDELPVLLEGAKTRLINGGWPDRVSQAFSDALIAVLTQPRFGPDRKPNGELEQHASLLACITSDLRFVGVGDPDRSRSRLEDRFSEEATYNWWLEHDSQLIEKLLASPECAMLILEATIRDAVTFAKNNGTPRLPEIDMVRYGWALFGDPNPVT
jgi:hypothetical protein